jgi:Ribbon-helix-helix protein, copG family
MNQSDASSSKMMRRISVSLREDQYLGLEEVAEDLGVNLSDAAREAINAYLLKQHWGGTIGNSAEEAIKRGLTNREVLELVKSKFPHAATTLDSIAWYRSQLRKLPDSAVQTDREAKARRGEITSKPIV